jgi:biopolymer transport protein ExbD
MGAMVRAAAVGLAFLPGVAAWALLGTADLGRLVGLGVLALLGAVWTLAQPMPRGLRAGAAAFACATLLGTTGFRMMDLAGSFRPFSTSGALEVEDLVEQQLPVASEGEYPLDKPDADRLRVIVHIDRFGALIWKQKAVSLDDVGAILDNSAHRDPKVLIRCDKELPYQHFAWLASVVAAHGHGEVLVGVEKFAKTPVDAAALGAELSLEHWPKLELVLPIVPAGEPSLRLVGTEWRSQMWPPLSSRGLPDSLPRGVEPIPTGILYRLGDRETADLAELAGWMRLRPPKSIEPDPTVPVKFVVAVENEIRKAGHPPAALVLPSPPDADVRKAEYLPYPTAR